MHKAIDRSMVRILIVAGVFLELVRGFQYEDDDTYDESAYADILELGESEELEMSYMIMPNNSKKIYSFKKLDNDVMVIVVENTGKEEITVDFLIEWEGFYNNRTLDGHNIKEYIIRRKERPTLLGHSRYELETYIRIGITTTESDFESDLHDFFECFDFDDVECDTPFDEIMRKATAGESLSLEERYKFTEKVVLESRTIILVQAQELADEELELVCDKASEFRSGRKERTIPSEEVEALIERSRQNIEKANRDLSAPACALTIRFWTDDIILLYQATSVFLAIFAVKIKDGSIANPDQFDLDPCIFSFRPENKAYAVIRIVMKFEDPNIPTGSYKEILENVFASIPKLSSMWDNVVEYADFMFGNLGIAPEDKIASLMFLSSYYGVAGEDYLRYMYNIKSMDYEGISRIFEVFSDIRNWEITTCQDEMVKVEAEDIPQYLGSEESSSSGWE